MISIRPALSLSIRLVLRTCIILIRLSSVYNTCSSMTDFFGGLTGGNIRFTDARIDGDGPLPTS
jgi:hypothetical protein